MILLMFCLEERNMAIVFARLRVISFSMHQFKELERYAVIKFKKVDREELEADIIPSSAYRYQNHEEHLLLYPFHRIICRGHELVVIYHLYNS